MDETERLLPDECARAYGQVRTLPSHVHGFVTEFTATHEAARALHGWGRDGDPSAMGDAHNAARSEDRLRLTRAEYEAALMATSDCDKRGVPRPFLPALSPHAHDYAAVKASATQSKHAEVPGDKDGAR
jgi:hypothetical protein